MKSQTKVLRYHASLNLHSPVIAVIGRSGNLKTAKNIWNWARYLMRACWYQERLTSPLYRSIGTSTTTKRRSLFKLRKWVANSGDEKKAWGERKEWIMGNRLVAWSIAAGTCSGGQEPWHCQVTDMTPANSTWRFNSIQRDLALALRGLVHASQQLVTPTLEQSTSNDR